jgi:hypothetical protein
MAKDKLILRFEKMFKIEGRNGASMTFQTIGPFDNENDARLWLIKYRAILASAKAGNVFLEVLRNPEIL